MSDTTTLSDTFVVELFKAAFKNEKLFEVLIKHLKYSYLTFDYEKKFWKECINSFYEKNHPPTLGLVQARLRKQNDVADFITEIRTADDVNLKDLYTTFEEYIKESLYVEAFEKSAELYNRGEQNQALETYKTGAKKIESFSIQDKVYEKLFEDFEERFSDRTNPEEHNDKCPFYIDEIDEQTMGGPERGETVLFLAESGIGKSQLLVHIAVRTAAAGDNVMFFQIEGTKKQVMTRMDAAWSGLPYHDVKIGRYAGNDNIAIKRRAKINNAIKKMKGEVYIEAFEKFGGITTMGIKNSIREAKKLYGDIKVVCIDYLELCDLDDGIKWTPNMERFRQQKIAQHFKEIAMEENVAIFTVTQASNLSSDLKNDPSFCMTREFLSEDKGKIRPFDFFYTLNQTWDEKKNRNEKNEPASIIRMFADKIRDYDSGQVTHIVTNFKRSRFYDKNRTVEYVLNLD